MSVRTFSLAGVGQHAFGPHGALYNTRDQVPGYKLVVEPNNPYAREHTAIAVFALAGGAWHKVGYVPATRLETAHAENWVDRPCTLFSMRGDTIYMKVHPLPPAPVAPAAPAAYGDDMTLEDDDIVVVKTVTLADKATEARAAAVDADALGDTASAAVSAQQEVDQATQRAAGVRKAAAAERGEPESAEETDFDDTPVRRHGYVLDDFVRDSDADSDEDIDGGAESDEALERERAEESEDEDWRPTKRQCEEMADELANLA